MIYIMENLCDSSHALNTIYLVKIAISALTIAVPIILIVSLMITCVRFIVTNDQSLIAQLKSGAINKIIASFVVFLVPLGVDILLKTIGTGSAYTECYNNANPEYIAQRKSVEEIEKEAERTLRSQQAANKAKQIAEQRAQSAVTGTSGEVRNPIQYAESLVYYNQGDYPTTYLCSTSSGASIKSHGCGHTSFSMIAATFGNRTYTPVDFRNIMCNPGNKNGAYSGGALGYWFFTDSKLLDTLGLKSENLFPYDSSSRTYNSTNGNKILNAVRQGKGVIIYIPGHYVAVGQNPSCNENEVYYYDPGSRSNRGCYTMNALWNKTYNYSNRCTNSGKCGWKGAWAFSGK